MVYRKVFDIPKELVSRCYDDSNSLAVYRDNFMRDRDRVLYCTAFRRLAGKTQIYTTGIDDHRKNRLTHSLEVSQIARTIAKALGLNETLAEAIALAHDFGHTPFGHAGEEMLHEIMVPGSSCVKNSPFFCEGEDSIKRTIERECGEKEVSKINEMFGFKHNIQSVRVATVLEDSYRNEQGFNIGLNLTNYTLWGVLQHSKIKYSDKSPYPNYQNYFRKIISTPNEGKDAWSLEAYIVRLADDIAQWHHDLEDAIRGQALSNINICETIGKALGTILLDEDKECLESIKEETKIERIDIAKLSHIVVNTLVTDVVRTTKKNMKSIMTVLKGKKIKHIEDVRLELFTNFEELDLDLNRDKIVQLSDAVNEEEFKSIIKSSVHHSQDVERMNAKGKYIIRKLFEAYFTHPQQLPDGIIMHVMVDVGEYKNIDEARDKDIGIVRTEFDKMMENPKLISQCVLMRRVCDHIASMTDRYAMEEYNNLYG